MKKLYLIQFIGVFEKRNKGVLKRKNRLKKTKDFERVFEKGKGAVSENLILKAVRNNLSFFRAGFVVSRKISNKAVVRNKVKRRLRHIIQEKQKMIKKGWDLVFVARPGIQDQDFQTIRKQAFILLRTLGLLEKKENKNEGK